MLRGIDFMPNINQPQLQSLFIILWGFWTVALHTVRTNP